MKKILGIGCLVIVLAFIAVAGIGFYWVKGKAEGVITTVQKTAAVQKKQQAVFNALDAKYPFTPPAAGKALKLDEARLQAYLDIRKALLPVYAEIDAKAKTLNAKYKDDHTKSFSEGMHAMNDGLAFFTEAQAKVRDAYASQLDAHQMSPREFHFITATLYRSQMSQGMAQVQEAQRQALPQMIASLEQQKNAPGMSDEQKAELQKQIDSAKSQLAALPPAGKVTEDQATIDANNALIAKHKVDIEKDANFGFDAFLLGADQDMSKAWDSAFKQNAPSGSSAPQ